MTAAAGRRRRSRQADVVAVTFAVQCRKTATGAWTTFNTYATRAESHAVAHRLREVGAAVRVVTAGEGTRG